MDVALLFKDFLHIFFIVTSPITFLVGIFLLWDVENYLKLERFLGKSYGLKKIFSEQLERNRAELQNFLLRWRRYVGVVCMLHSVSVVFVVANSIR